MLAGCVSQPQPPQLNSLQFEVLGKMAVRSGTQGQSLRFNWRQYADGYVIAVWGPLGQGRTVLSGNQAFMRVQRGAQLLAQGAPQDVMQQHLGWSVPVTVLSSWIRGEAHPGFAVQEISQSADGDLQAFTQAGWRVSLADLRQRSQRRTPAKIVAIRQQQKITVAVRSFQEV